MYMDNQLKVPGSKREREGRERERDRDRDRDRDRQSERARGAGRRWDDCFVETPGLLPIFGFDRRLLVASLGRSCGSNYCCGYVVARGSLLPVEQLRGLQGMERPVMWTGLVCFSRQFFGNVGLQAGRISSFDHRFKEILDFVHSPLV